MTAARASAGLLGAALLPRVLRAQTATGVEPFDEISGVVLSLVVVIGLILLAAWLLRRSPLGGATRKSGPLRIIATLPLGPKERLVLVEAVGRELLVGVSPAGIVPLHRDADRASTGTGATTPSESHFDLAPLGSAIDLAKHSRLSGAAQ